MKSVNILRGIYAVKNCIGVEVLRQRHLNENAMDLPIRVKPVNNGFKLGLSGG